MKALIYNRMEDNDSYKFMQLERIAKEYYDNRLALSGYTFAGFWRDAADTATSLLSQRPGGSNLLVEAHRGDIVVVSNMVQTWPGLSDMVTVLKIWKRLGVSCHILSLGLDISEEEPGALDVLAATLDMENKINEWKPPVEPKRDELYRIMKDLFDQGLKSSQVADRLTRMGIMTLGGVKWHGGTVRAFMARYRSMMNGIPDELPCSPSIEASHE